MGTSKSGSFDMRPDFNQWAMLLTSDEIVMAIPSFVNAYCSFFHCDMRQFIMEPVTGHGSWDGKQLFKSFSQVNSHEAPIAVLTRATIRFSRLKNFWNNASRVAKKMNTAQGLLVSYGVGELPFIKQATFSVWENESCMIDFAYKTDEHTEVIRRTRKDDWYKEELFVRFRIISVTGFDEKIAAKMCNLPALYEEA